MRLWVAPAYAASIGNIFAPLINAIASAAVPMPSFGNDTVTS